MTQASRILLVRHGRSSHRHDGSWMHARHVRDYERAYNAAGILDEDVPPPQLIASAASARVIAASDLPRAIASAQRLGPGRELAISPLLREIELEPPPWLLVRLPIQFWDLYTYVQWTLRLKLGADHDHVRERAADAVDWLESHAQGNATVVAITHGGFRRLIASRLEARGWIPTPGKRSYANWSVWEFSPSA